MTILCPNNYLVARAYKSRSSVDSLKVNTELGTFNSARQKVSTSCASQMHASATKLSSARTTTRSGNVIFNQEAIYLPKSVSKFSHQRYISPRLAEFEKEHKLASMKRLEAINRAKLLNKRRLGNRRLLFNASSHSFIKEE